MRREFRGRWDGPTCPSRRKERESELQQTQPQSGARHCRHRFWVNIELTSASMQSRATEIKKERLCIVHLQPRATDPEFPTRFVFKYCEEMPRQRLQGDAMHNLLRSITPVRVRQKGGRSPRVVSSSPSIIIMIKASLFELQSMRIAHGRREVSVRIAVLSMT